MTDQIVQVSWFLCCAVPGASTSERVRLNTLNRKDRQQRKAPVVDAVYGRLLMQPTRPRASPQEQRICGTEGVDRRASYSARGVTREKQRDFSNFFCSHRLRDGRPAATCHQLAIALGIDNAWANTVYLDAVPGQFGGQAFGQVYQPCFACPIGATAASAFAPTDG